MRLAGAFHAGPLRSTFLLVGSGGVAALLGYVWTLLAGRFLPPAEYADFTASAAILYFVVVALGPIVQTVSYFTAKASGRDEALAVARSVERAVWRVGAVVFGATAALSPFLANPLRFISPLSPVVILGSAWAVSVIAVRRGFLLGSSRFGAYATSIVAEATLRLAGIVAIGMWMPTGVAGIGTYGATTFLVLLFSPMPRGGGTADPRPIARYFAPALATTAVYAAFLNADVVWVKFLFTTGDAALYGAASFLGRAPGMLIAPFSAFAVPHLVEAGGDALELRRRFARVFAYYVAMATAIIVILAAVRRPLIALLLGPGYAAAADLVIPISVAVTLGGLVFLVTHLPMSRGAFGFLRWYAAGFAIEIGAVALWHETKLAVIQAVIAAHLATLALVLWRIIADERTSRPGGS